MITTDKIADGKLLTLPPEAGDVNAPRFQPNDAWLREAPPDQQKTAMWRWFATRYEEPSQAAPHDEQGEFDFTDGGPCLADEVLHERFDGCVPRPVVDELVASVQAEAGNEWVPKGLDEAGD